MLFEHFERIIGQLTVFIDLLSTIGMLRPLGTFPLLKKTLDLLIKNGFNYLEDIEKAPESAKKFVDVDALMKICAPPVAISALEHWQAELLCQSVTTFSKALDILLDGGFHCGSITELCGAPGTGKTQICFQICISAQLSQAKGGLEGKVLFIDSRSSFSSIRIQDLIEGCKKDHPDLRKNEVDWLSGVTVVSVHTAQELFSTIGKLREYLRSNSNYRVIIIDSLSLPVLCSIEDGSMKYKFYFKVFDELQKLALEYNLAVIIVNELVTQVDSKGNTGFTSAGNQAVAHRCQKRVLLARLNDTTFAAKILKSSISSKTSKTFMITGDGIRN